MLSTKCADNTTVSSATAMNPLIGSEERCSHLYAQFDAHCSSGCEDNSLQEAASQLSLIIKGLI